MEIVMFIASFVIGFLIGKGFSIRSNQKLEQETSKLRKLDQLILKSMELEKSVKFVKDEHGIIKGHILDIKPDDVAFSSIDTSPSIEKKEGG